MYLTSDILQPGPVSTNETLDKETTDKPAEATRRELLDRARLVLHTYVVQTDKIPVEQLHQHLENQAPAFWRALANWFGQQALSREIRGDKNPWGWKKIRWVALRNKAKRKTQYLEEKDLNRRISRLVKSGLTNQGIADKLNQEYLPNGTKNPDHVLYRLRTGKDSQWTGKLVAKYRWRHLTKKRVKASRRGGQLTMLANERTDTVTPAAPTAKPSTTTPPKVTEPDAPPKREPPVTNRRSFCWQEGPHQLDCQIEEVKLRGNTTVQVRLTFSGELYHQSLADRIVQRLEQLALPRSLVLLGAVTKPEDPTF